MVGRRKIIRNFLQAFDPKGFQVANPIFNRDKLDWFNGYYIRQISNENLLKKFENLNLKFEKLNENLKLKIVNLVKDRIKKINDFNELAKFFWEMPKVDKKLLGKNYKEHLSAAIDAIEKGTPLDKVPKDNNFKVGDFFMDLRIAVTGSRFTPPINESIEIIGKEEALERLKIVL
ncbi:MAG: Glutamate-tRNA ligase [Candidatus Woesebacteria bacterium GW2011_GWB1_41_10]|uniref:Glutamate-tRNA ligase n=1 Tax=Candidatus Woesebacteria bacterium GW2011_GWB1_41_10 TaxID=1618577 RepID=A0A0G0U589_9BACT|nr:MAG: Glutamate-tRNA ligase [Candidatus Woesebacteria bacterium GW2011_GWB1_41_10]